MEKTLMNTDFIDRPLFMKGKVRDIYDLGENLLIVVTDRVSAFDVVFNEGIPGKGKVLNSIAAFWFDYTSDIVKNHVVSTDPEDYPEGLSRYKEQLEGRSMMVKKIEMLPAECIVRGYLEGSALKEYRKESKVSGIVLPEGLKQADELPEPIFTPSTKATEGHDINISYDELCEIIGEEKAARVKTASLDLYKKAADYAKEKGIILADTKFEFGEIDGELVVADEIFTPDSSRFWDMEEYEPGRPQKSFDKQYLREWLETLDWDKTYPPPKLPSEIIERTAAKYIDAYERLTGNKFS